MRVLDIPKRILEDAAIKARNLTHLISLLRIADGGSTRAKLRAQIIAFEIDVSHFKSHLRMRLSNEEFSASRKRTQIKLRKKYSLMRAELVDQERWILVDARQGDRRLGRHTDLDIEFIRDAIKDGCVYCGETKIRMTMDRKDNDAGHLKSNVVAACIRCNMARRDMPYAAWLVIAPKMREARELGLFGEWTARVN